MTKARTLADNFAADINGITAGTGITGGGTSGTVTVTNSMATAIDAKGDLVVGTGADTFSRLAVASTAGYLLSVDSAEATGLKWAAPASSTVSGAVVYGGTTQSLANNTWTALTFASETYDTDGYHSTVTDTSRFTIPAGKAGKYLVMAATYFLNNANGYRQLAIYKNGGGIYYSGDYKGDANQFPGMPISAVVSCAVGDYLEIWGFQGSGGALNIYKPVDSFFGITYLGA